MPPFVQSANWQTLARQAGRLLTKVKPPNINTIKTTLPGKVIRAIHQSFPSLSTPAHLLELNPAYAFNSSGNQLSRGFNKAVTLNRLHQPFAQASRGIRTAARRPTTPFASNVGLGSARSYSAGPQQAFHGKVPMALRALASLVDQDTEKTLPGAARYKPYARPHKVIKTTKRSPRASTSSIDIERMDILFPRRIPAAGPVLADNLLQPEKLVTGGINTTLIIPIGKAYQDLLDTPPPESFAVNNLGINTYASLGKIPLDDILNHPAAPYLLSLLSKLDSLGITNITDEDEFAHFEVVPYYVEIGFEDYWLDELHLKFYDRSEMDVRRIIGESMRPRREGWILREERAIKVVTPAEALAALEQWADAQGPNWPRPRPIDNSELILPLIDVDSMATTIHPWDNDDARDWDEAHTPDSLLDGDSDGMSEFSVLEASLAQQGSPEYGSEWED
jgi:hypothetical protein